MKKLNIISSSYLPKNTSWVALEKNRELNFLNFCKLSVGSEKQFLQHDLAYVIFLNDYINDDNDVASILKSILIEVSTRLKLTSCKTFVCLLSFDNSSIISASKRISPILKSHSELLLQIELLGNEFSNLHLIDLNSYFSIHGLLDSLDDRNWYSARCRLSNRGLQRLSEALNRLIGRCDNSSAKILALDCDNTLWGGVVGEDGWNNVQLGQDGIGMAFLDFQKEIKKYHQNGILLVLCSKNNEDDVWEVFDKNANMLLKRNDIVSSKINWDDKSKNLIEISKELNLGLDSIVFWDDNPIERAQIKASLPKVHTVDVPVDPSDWPSLIAKLDELSNFAVSSEDLKRTEMYTSRAKFLIDSKSNTDNKISYLRSIKIEPSISKITPSNISRAEQLCLKTNQFNLRTIRHTQNDLLSLKKINDDFVFLVSMRDIYGDHGIIGLVCLRPINNDYLLIDTFLLSCRILGRHIETWILQRILEIAKKYDYKYVVGEYIPSSKNQMTSNFFLSNNFTPVNSIKEISNFKNNISSYVDLNNSYIMENNFSDIPFKEIYD